MMNAMYTTHKINIAAVTYGGSKDNKSDNPNIGNAIPTTLYFLRTFKVWMMKWDFVRPINAIGFNLNPFKYIVLKLFGMVEYKNNPASPVRLIKTLPVFLNFVINSVAVLRYFILRMLERIAVVRGIDHLFFLIG